MAVPPAFDLIAFGETMIRLTTVDDLRLESTVDLRVTIGGAESNVCVALARLGRPVAWLSALPDNPLGRRIAHELRGHGVAVDRVLWQTGGRAGLYFMETGSRPRPTRVTYDRANSAVATIDPQLVDPGLVSSARALHLTGITPALSPSCATVCHRLTGAAVEEGVPLVLDVNYRSLLWSPEEARAGLAPLLEKTTLLFCGAEDARTIWGFTGMPQDVGRNLLAISGADLAVVTLGESGACAVSRSGDVWLQPSMPVDIIDPVGAGDAFAAGFLHVWLDDRENIPAALQSAVALAALSMTIPGDLAIVSPDDLHSAITLLDAGPGDIIR